VRSRIARYCRTSVLLQPLALLAEMAHTLKMRFRAHKAAHLHSSPASRKRSAIAGSSSPASRIECRPEAVRHCSVEERERLSAIQEYFGTFLRLFGGQLQPWSMKTMFIRHAASVTLFVLLVAISRHSECRTKNARLQIRLGREARLRDGTAWDTIRSRLSPGILSRMDAIHLAQSPQDQFQILQELVSDVRGCGETPTSAAELDPNGTALALTSLVIARGAAPNNGPLSASIVSGLAALPDSALESAAYFFAQWLVGGRHAEGEEGCSDMAQAADRIGAFLCGLRGQQHILTKVCSKPDVFAGLVCTCINAMDEADDPQALVALHALKALLDMCHESLSAPTTDRGLGAIVAAKGCLTKMLSSRDRPRECQIAAAHSLAIIFLASSGDNRVHDMQSILTLTLSSGRFALLRFMLSRSSFSNFTSNEVEMMWSCLNLQHLTTTNDVHTAAEVRPEQSQKGEREQATEHVEHSEGRRQVHDDALGAAAQFLESETQSLRMGDAHARRNIPTHKLLGAIARVRDAVQCVMAASFGSGGVDDSKTLALYRLALTQRDVCIALARDESTPPAYANRKERGEDGAHRASQVDRALDGLRDVDLIRAAMGVSPSHKVRVC